MSQLFSEPPATAPSLLFRLAGWAAYLSAAANIAGAVTLVLFFSVGEPFGTMNDILSSVIALSMIPLALALHQLGRTVSVSGSLLAAGGALVSMVVAAGVSALLVARLITFAQSYLPTLTAFGMIGAWLVLANLLTRASGGLPWGLIWLGVSAGVGYMLSTVGFYLGGQNYLLLAAGGLLAAITYPIWAIWLGRVLLSNRFRL